MKIYSYILLLLFLTSVSLFAQKLEKKTIVSTAKTIILELESIEYLKLKTTNNSNTVEVAYEDVNDTNTPKIYEESSVIYVKVLGEPNKIEGSEKIKYRAGQPLYPKYIVSIPKGMNTNVFYDKGNFFAEDLNGNLELHINHGTVEINKFIGSVNIETFSGNINCTLKEATLDIETSKGVIESSLKDDKLYQTKNAINGIYKKPNNTLKIKTVNANLVLNPT